MAQLEATEARVRELEAAAAVEAVNLEKLDLHRSSFSSASSGADTAITSFTERDWVRTPFRGHTDHCSMVFSRFLGFRPFRAQGSCIEMLDDEQDGILRGV